MTLKTPHQTRKTVLVTPYHGIVVDNDDPLGQRRVRVRIPGVCEPQSAWALPVGQMLGNQNGLAAVPEVGANVVVQFVQGDKDRPIYQPGPFGAPGGVSQEPPQAPSGSKDHVTIRWRSFHITFDGTSGSESLTVEDLVSGTKLVMDRSTGDLNETVLGSKDEQVKSNLTTTVQEGDETHAVVLGKRTTTINGDDTRTIAAGNVTDTLTAGSKTLTAPAGSSTETLGQNKIVTAGLNIVLTAGGAVNIQAAGAVTVAAAGAVGITGSAVAMASTNPAIPSTESSAGVKTSQFLGGIDETVVGSIIRRITGSVIEQITGTYRKEISGLCEIVGQLDLGDGTMRRIVTEDMFSLWGNLHSHPAPGAVPTQKVTEVGGGSDIPISAVTAQRVRAS